MGSALNGLDPETLRRLAQAQGVPGAAAPMPNAGPALALRGATPSGAGVDPILEQLMARATVPRGQTAPGNIDLSNRPVVKNPDGSTSTVRSLGVNFGGQEVLIPTVRHGLDRIMTDDEAIRHYEKTGEHLGKFDSVDASNAYAQRLHEDQEAGIDSQTTQAIGGMPGVVQRRRRPPRPASRAKADREPMVEPSTVPVPNDFGAGGIAQIPVAQLSQQPQSMRPPGQLGPAPPVGADPDALMPMSQQPGAGSAAKAALGPASGGQKPGTTGADRGRMLASFLRQQQAGMAQGSPGLDASIAELIRRRGRGGY